MKISVDGNIIIVHVGLSFTHSLSMQYERYDTLRFKIMYYNICSRNIPPVPIKPYMSFPK